MAGAVGQWAAGEAGDGRADRAEEERQELGLPQRAERDDQHAAARSGDAHELAQPAGHVTEQRHAVLRRGEVKRVVVQVQRVAVHDAGVDGQSLVTGAGGEPLDHDR